MGCRVKPGNDIAIVRFARSRSRPGMKSTASDNGGSHVSGCVSENMSTILCDIAFTISTWFFTLT